MSIVLSVATAAEGFTSIVGVLPGIGFHALCAVAGVQLVSAAKRRTRVPGPTAERATA